MSVIRLGMIQCQGLRCALWRLGVIWGYTLPLGWREVSDSNAPEELRNFLLSWNILSTINLARRHIFFISPLTTCTRVVPSPFNISCRISIFSWASGSTMPNYWNVKVVGLIFFRDGITWISLALQSDQLQLWVSLSQWLAIPRISLKLSSLSRTRRAGRACPQELPKRTKAQDVLHMQSGGSHCSRLP